MQSLHRSILERKGGIKDLLLRSMDVVEQCVEEEAGLHGRHLRKHSPLTTSDSTSTSPASNNGVGTFSKHQELDEELEKSVFLDMDRGTAISVAEISKAKDAGPVDITIPEHTNLQAAVEKITEIGSTSLIAENRYCETELDLDKVYNQAVEHEFFCPNCKSCIRKVIVRELGSDSAPVFDQNDDRFRCLSCFSFLIPADNWFFRNSAPDGEQRRNEQDANQTRQDIDIAICRKSDSQREKVGSDHAMGHVETDHQLLQKMEPDDKKNIQAEESGEEDDAGLPESSSILIPNLGEDEQTTRIPPESRDGKKWQIIRSIVYGGLNESITSLGVVTSAASSDATTLNILAMTLANLVGGLFVIGHNLRELKNEQPGNNYDQTNEQTDRYEELLGNRQNHILHAIIAILSFLVFGLVPPVVYAFSFRKSDNKDYKLAAVDGASLLCITMLAICKAYVRRHPKRYIRTVIYNVIAGFMASGFAYLAGELVKSLLEKSGLFKPEVAFSGPFGEISSGRSVAWASY